MAEGTDNICQFNNVGYCKFGTLCQKKHSNKIFELLDECREKSCEKRHPKLCRYYSERRRCRFRENCAYTHKDEEDIKTKVIGQITSLVMKHEKDISTLYEEVIMLKNLVQNLALQGEVKKERKNQDNVQKEGETTQKENPLRIWKLKFSTLKQISSVKSAILNATN